MTSQGYHLIQKDASSGTVTVTCSPSASNPPSSYVLHPTYPNYWDWTQGLSSVSFTVYPVTMDLEGVTVDPSDKSLNVLTGQQVTAVLNSPFPASNFSWSFTGATGYNPFYNWDPTAPNASNPTQFVPIPAAYLTQSTISFYDAADGDGVTVNCAATITLPSGPPLNVNVASKSITYHKPSVAWTVNVPYNGYSTGFFNGLPNGPFGAQELWGPMKITVPLPFDTTFNPGFGAILQIATPGRSNTRIPLNGKPSTYSKLSVLYGDGSTGSIASPTGLDAGVPYPFGSRRNPDGTYSNNYGSLWDALDDGWSGDRPQQPYTNSDQDGGGNAWNASAASDSFNTWVMYLPTSVDDQGTIYVPLQMLTWSWGGNASLNHFGKWDVDENPPFSPGTPSQTDTYPSWNLTIPLNPTIGP